MATTNQNLVKFCPRCSSSGAHVADSRKIVCAECGFELYLNTAAAVAALISGPDGRVMFIRRNRDPQKGLLDLPGGFVDFGESAEGAIRREVLEELGVSIDSVEYYRSAPNVYEYRSVVYHTLDLFFTCRFAQSPAPVELSDEIAEVAYRFPEEIADDEIAFESMKKIIGEMRVAARSHNKNQ